MSLPTDSELKKIFQLKNIAVIGCSSNPLKPSHMVPKYLHENGYNVIPVNPNASEKIFSKIKGDFLYNNLNKASKVIFQNKI